MWWTPRRRSKTSEPEPINHTDPLPEGDRVLKPGQRRLAELLDEHTALIPVVTPAARHRGRGAAAGQPRPGCRGEP